MRNWFKLSRWESSGIISLNILIGLLIIYRIWDYRTPKLDSDQIRKLDSLEQYLIAQDQLKIKKNSEEENSVLSASSKTFTERRNNPSQQVLRIKSFDPNSISLQELMQFGVSSKKARTFVNFRKAIGSYTSAKDFSKLYGWNESELKALGEKAVFPSLKSKQRTQSSAQSVELQPIHLNKMDTADLISIRGIGPILAKRIIAYRNVLGGFIKKEQLFEVWGLDSSVVLQNWNNFMVDTLLRDKLDINTATITQLKKHPYINYKLAKAMVMYRNQHGNYSAIEQIMNSVLVGREDYLKIAPYLTISKSGATITSSN